MRCKCGTELIYDEQYEPKYYCSLCDVVWNGYMLDCEDTYEELIGKKYKKCFNKYFKTK